MSNGNLISIPDSRARTTFLLKTREHFILPKHIMSMGGPTRVSIGTISAYSHRYLLPTFCLPFVAATRRSRRCDVRLIASLKAFSARI